MRDWHEKYADLGLNIVGVHTPEFEFEKDYDNVVAAVMQHDLGWRMVQDNDFRTWRSYNNRVLAGEVSDRPRRRDSIPALWGRPV